VLGIVSSVQEDPSGRSTKILRAFILAMT